MFAECRTKLYKTMIILWRTNYECILSTQLTGNAVTNDVSITAADAAAEDGDRSV